jgi:alkylation response protein AidB-like acyl-CoA dehydrogenase
MQEDALRLDQISEFPHEIFSRLRNIGLLTATLPETLGGKNFGQRPEGAAALLQLLALLGEGSLPVARLYEAHINALQLICRYGTGDLAIQAARDAAAGHLFALWVTDPGKDHLALKPRKNSFLLEGTKAFCSGAGMVTRALVTAATNTGTQMLIVQLEAHARVIPSDIKLGGMRAAVTGCMNFSGMPVEAASLVGVEGDYLREPVFSAGAWRGSAAALGGLAALVKFHRDEMLARRRDTDPYQRMRFGQLLIQYETARLWMQKAALRACLEVEPPDAIIAYVNLARLAVEAASLEAMRLTQRSLGLGAFMAGTKVELLCRDLATYLRQPAPDEALDKAAEHFFRAGPSAAS